MSSLLLGLLVSLATVSFSAADHPEVVAAPLLEGKESCPEKVAVPELTREDLKQVQELADLLGEFATFNADGCSCTQASMSCSCCTDINVPEIHLKSSVCANVAYNSNPSGLIVSLTFDGKVIFKKMITVPQPPPLCLGLPGVRLATLCIEFSNLKWDGKHLSGCLTLQVKMLTKAVLTINLGCFNLGSSSQNVNLIVSPSGLQLLTHKPSSTNDVEEVISDADIVFQSALEVEDKSVLYFSESFKVMPRLIEMLKTREASDTQ